MDAATLEKTLNWIGLSKNEARIYVSLLRMGSSKAGKISKHSQLNRTSTYDALRQLLSKGLVSYVVKENRKWFEAVNPDRIVEYIKEKEDEAKKIVPELKKINSIPKERHNVTLFYGYKGIKTVFQDIVREGKSNYVLDSSGKFIEKMPIYAQQFIKLIEEKNISIRHIVRKGVEIKPSKTTEVREFSSGSGGSIATTNIYADKVAIIIWTDPPEAVLIKNNEVASLFKSYFNNLWKISKKLHPRQADA